MSDSPPADAAPAPPPAPGAFAVGSACFCAHQSNWYKARVRQVAGDGGRRRYLVHYDGWNARTDAWVDGAALRAADHDFGPAAAAEPAAADGGAAPAAPPAKRRKRGAAAAPAAPAAAPADGGGARLRLPLPRELRDVLVRDWEQVTREPRHWPALPRSPTVAELLAGFVDGKAAAAPGAQAAKWRDVGAALLAYFDACLPKLLLYRQEREQWASRSARGATPAALYGAEHLLRLLAKLPALLVKTDLAPGELPQLAAKLGALVDHLAKRRGELFLDHYELREAHLGAYGLGAPER